jgi:hypothetical protein
MWGTNPHSVSRLLQSTKTTMSTNNPDPAMIEAWEKYASEPVELEPGIYEVFRAGWEARDMAMCEVEYEDGSYCSICSVETQEADNDLPFCPGCGRRWKIKTEQP